MSFYTEVITKSKWFGLDNFVCKDTDMLEPGTRAAVLAVVNEAKAGGIELRVLETYRSQRRQARLFAQGATKLRVVGCHGYGVAVDFGVFINGKYQENNKPYTFLRKLARKHGLISGQDWGRTRTGSFVDSGHVQKIPVWRQNDLFSGRWYPEPDYDAYADSAAHGQKDVVKTI